MRPLSRKVCFITLLALTATITTTTLATIEEDEKECADQMANMASCIPYVSGSAKQPTKQCCDDTSKVKSAKPKCLCVLIKESADPSMGLPINTTLALQMPKACNIDAKVSDCPSLLNIAADSPEAKIFKVANEDSTTSSTSTDSHSDSTDKSPSSSSSTSSSDTAKTTKMSSTSNGGDGSRFMASGVIILMMGLGLIVGLRLE